MSVIDFRLRPLYKGYQEGFPDGLIRRFFDVFGYELTDAVKERTEESLLKELDEAGVVKSVIPGRAIPGFDNEQLFELADKYPDRFIVYPFLDVTDVEKALRDIDTYIINGKGQGASIEPGVGSDLKFDDESLFPIYRKLEQNNIPVMVTISGWVTKVFDVTLPAQVDVVLNHFPKLKLIAAHAAWPFLKEIVAVAFKHPNLYLTADFEGTRGVGAHDLRDGALYMVKDQVIFASSFPLGPIAQGVQSVKDWKLPIEVENKILYGNAAKLLGL
ncbi:MAG: amidohydrolase family protein [Acetatifactor sp.]